MSSPPVIASSRSTFDHAFVLHSIPYKETSLIVELFTSKYGRLPVIAKGAKRRNSALRSVLVHFQPLDVQFTGRSEVKTLSAAAWAGQSLGPEGRSLFAAYYLNELLMAGLRREDPHPELFDHYTKAMVGLSQSRDMSLVVRCFELDLLVQLGYGFDFEHDVSGSAIKPELLYGLEPDVGWLVKHQPDGRKAIQGESLLQIAQGEMSVELAQLTKPFTREMLNRHIVPEGLLSRIWMEQLLKYD